jgi:FkbM family methyltransferase
MRGTAPPPLSPSALAAVAALLERPLTALDVGCRDGVRAHWRTLGENALLVGFDPDPHECARLAVAAPGPARELYVPVALGGRDGTATLHVTADPQSSSLYPPDAVSIDRHPELWRHAPRTTAEVAISTIASWALSADVSAVDALKVDVQGAELDVIRGAGRLLDGIRALEAEVEFAQLYEGQPLFCDLDAFLRSRGFVLWRLRELHHCGLARAGRGEPVFGVGEYVERTRLGGRLAWANALWVRDEMGAADAPLGWQERARNACVAAIFGLPELVELSLRVALAHAPAEARPALARALGDGRRRGLRRRAEDLVRRAPSHVRGFLRARVSAGRGRL